MDKRTENSDRNKEIDAILAKHKTLDDICIEIFFTLMAYKKLRFNELHRCLKKFGTDISKPALIEHLKHLMKKKLIKRKHEGFQKVTYGLTEKIASLLHVPEEEIMAGVENFFKMGQRGSSFLPFDPKVYYSRLSEKQLDQETDKDLRIILRHNLFELKTFINYDLKLEKPESDTIFWNFVGNPLYRMLEKNIVENCRNSQEYKTNLFEKIDILINALRSNRELGERNKNFLK